MNVFNRLKQVASVSSVALCISVAAMSQATAASERYIVSGVESWDTLNIRSEPNAKSTIIGEIPSNGSAVNSDGQQVGAGRSTWIKVNWNGVNGWVNKRYLATDYTFTAPAAAPVQSQTYVNTTNYTSQTTQNTQRSGSIYDAGTGTVRNVYVGPGNGLPAITPKRQTTQVVQQRPVNTANTHTHPANRCTRSVSHTHPNGVNQHTHRYSCQGQATQQQPQVQVRAVAQTNANTHTHPRNQFTNAVTHTHASGSSQHKHNYGGQRQVQQPQVQVRAVTQNSANTHTHPRNQFTNAVTHTHASGSSQHKHNYGGQRQVQQPQVQVRAVTQTSANTHTHPRNQFTNAVTHTHASGSAQHSHNYGGQQQAQQVQQQRQVTVSNGAQLITHIHPASPYNKQTQHTHAGGAGVHVHDFLLPPRQAATVQVSQNSANTHSHPANNLTRSVSHTHPNGANQHSHSYGGQR